MRTNIALNPSVLYISSQLAQNKRHTTPRFLHEAKWSRNARYFQGEILPHDTSLLMPQSNYNAEQLLTVEKVCVCEGVQWVWARNCALATKSGMRNLYKTRKQSSDPIALQNWERYKTFFVSVYPDVQKRKLYPDPITTTEDWSKTRQPEFKRETALWRLTGACETCTKHANNLLIRLLFKIEGGTKHFSSLFIPTCRNANCTQIRSLLPKTDQKHVAILFQDQWHYVSCTPLLPSKAEYADKTPDSTPQAVNTGPMLTRPNIGSKIE